MGLLADLASGKLGLVVAPPDHLTIKAEDATSAAFNAAPGQGWWLFFFPGLHLDLDAAHDAMLERDIERHTRVLFETMFAQLAASAVLATADVIGDRQSCHQAEPICFDQASALDGDRAHDATGRTACQDGR